MAGALIHGAQKIGGDYSHNCNKLNKTKILQEKISRDFLLILSISRIWSYSYRYLHAIIFKIIIIIIWSNIVMGCIYKTRGVY